MSLIFNFHFLFLLSFVYCLSKRTPENILKSVLQAFLHMTPPKTEFIFDTESQYNISISGLTPIIRMESAVYSPEREVITLGNLSVSFYYTAKVITNKDPNFIIERHFETAESFIEKYIFGVLYGDEVTFSSFYVNHTAYDLSITNLEKFKDVIPEKKKRSYASFLRELFSESVYDLIFTKFPSTNDIQLQNYTKEIIQSRFIPIPDGISANVSEIYIMQVRVEKYFTRKYSFKDLYAYVKGREDENEEFYMMVDFKDVFFYEKVITVSNMMIKNQMKFPEWCSRNEFQKVVEYVFKSIIASVDLKMDL